MIADATLQKRNPEVLRFLEQCNRNYDDMEKSLRQARDTWMSGFVIIIGLIFSLSIMAKLIRTKIIIKIACIVNLNLCC